VEQRLNIITLGVKDLNEPIRFYESELGWQKMGYFGMFIDTGGNKMAVHSIG